MIAINSTQRVVFLKSLKHIGISLNCTSCVLQHPSQLLGLDGNHQRSSRFPLVICVEGAK